MSWRDILKGHCTEKMGCNCGECAKKAELSPKQKKIAEAAEPKDKITGEDFKSLKKKAKVKCPKCKGKGCEHCKYTGYHEVRSRGAFTDRD
jgi:hypothetical protein